MTTPNEQQAEELAQAGATDTQIDQAAQGYATEYEADDPFEPQSTTLPTLPALPEGFDWKVVLREHRDSTNLTDNGADAETYYHHWYWEDGRPIVGHKKAIIFLRQNGVILKQKTVDVEGLDTELEFVSRIVKEAEHLYSAHDADRRGWLAKDFGGLQES